MQHRVQLALSGSLIIGVVAFGKKKRPAPEALSGFLGANLKRADAMLDRAALSRADLTRMCAEKEKGTRTDLGTERGENWRDKVERASDLLIEIYGAQALARAQSVQASSLVKDFAGAVTQAVERKLKSMQ